VSWLVHLYTASGGVMALVAAVDGTEGRFRSAFFWLAAAVVVDATDGFAARRVGVARRLPGFDGALLDNLIDFTTYVFVPALLILQARLVPGAWAMPVAALVILSSAYGFSRRDAKTEDHLFTGFPSYWNIVAFYLWVARLAPAVNAAVLAGLVLLVFVPIRWVYPSRTETLRGLTLTLGALWGVSMAGLLWQAPDVSASLLGVSLVFPAYYAILSGVLSVRRARSATS